ncbi:MAG: transcription factor [Methanoregula sp. PtaU1.Bin051]|nr:MAG: transcription factor [Methanoregula sp. PtaU1.Bin051]
MCGETIHGPPKLVRVEGAELQVCSRCEKFGTAVQQPKRTDVRRPAPAAGPAGRVAAPPQATVYRRRDMFDYMEGEIVDDYSDRIRHAREAKGLSQKDLALQMMERELLIKKIEKGELVPEEDVRKKLEKVLNIRLLETIASDAEKKGKADRLAPTLGDVTIIRKVKK